MRNQDSYDSWDNQCVFCCSINIVITDVSFENIDRMYCADCKNTFHVGYFCNVCHNLMDMLGFCKNKCNGDFIPRVLY